MINAGSDNTKFDGGNGSHRRLIAVDIENIVGGAVITRSAAGRARKEIGLCLGIRPDELVVVGTSHIGALNTWTEWGSARIVLGSGPNGADRALLGDLDTNWIATRFAELVLVSGDIIFSDLVYDVVHKGIPVTVVAREGCCSTRLRLMATSTILLPLSFGLNKEAA